MGPARELDIVLFGATGVTGAYVVEELHRASEELRWGVAGRDADKLRCTLRATAKNIGLQEDALDSVPIIVADVADEASLLAMAQRTRLVLNVVGPYRFYGRPVVKACVDSCTHHIDVSAEVQYMERMLLEFYDEARKKDISVIMACGFGSIPAEMCLSYMRNHFPGDLNQMESYMAIKQGPLGMKVNTGTWESVIHMLAHASELASLRRQNRATFTKPLPERHPRLTRSSAASQPGFSPFEMIYGRRVRGPRGILKETTGDHLCEEVKTTHGKTNDDAQEGGLHLSKVAEDRVPGHALKTAVRFRTRATKVRPLTTRLHFTES